MLHGLITAALLAALGAAVGWIIYAAVTNATLVAFRTGSMAPAMPQGALALTVPVRAEEIEVGDVITVARSDGDLPVTHRVVEVSTPTGSLVPPEARRVILKGDANAHPDSPPYVLTEARRVTLALPRAGHWLMVAQSPPGMALLILGAGTLTAWALWPRGAQGTT